jgi:hypothetical protein
MTHDTVLLVDEEALLRRVLSRMIPKERVMRLHHPLDRRVFWVKAQA